jgi:transcriptional regulator with XRE-family HTH domain
MDTSKEQEPKTIPFYRAHIIRGIMAEKQITVRELVSLSDVSDVTISRIRGGRPIDMKKLRQVADALGIKWADLFNFEADAETTEQQASAA